MANIDLGWEVKGSIQADESVIGMLRVIEEKPHERFKRSDNDLYINVEIDLLTALTGGAFAIKHLDERALLVSLGEVVIKHGAFIDFCVTPYLTLLR